MGLFSMSRMEGGYWGAGGDHQYERGIMRERKEQPWDQEIGLLTLAPFPADSVGP